jgi:hypothetical protein
MYAFKTIHQLCQDMAFGPVIGQVYLWGQIVEHTRGYRAEFAYPKALITTYEADAALLREKWNVEVEVGNVQNIYEQTKRSIMRKLEAEYLKERGE